MQEPTEKRIKLTVLQCDWKENFKGAEVREAIDDVGGAGVVRVVVDALERRFAFGEHALNCVERFLSIDEVDAKLLFVCSEELTAEQLQELWKAGDLMLCDLAWDSKDYYTLVTDIEEYVRSEEEKETGRA